MSKLHPAYEAFWELNQEIRHFQSVLSLLHWDQETYMPPGGVTERSAQTALLSRHVHELKTSKRYRALLEKLVRLPSGAVKVKGLKKNHLVALREWVKDFTRSSKLPPPFVAEFAQVTSEASQVWAVAKQQNNFKLFAPFLRKIVQLNQKKAELYGFTEHPYDALVEHYEPSMTSRKLSTLFDPLQKELTRLVKKIGARKAPDTRFLAGEVSPDIQREIGLELLTHLPLELGYTRLDLSNHPFSIALDPRDSRITTRLEPHRFVSTLFTILHEAGHSFYEMGLPIETLGTPLSEACSTSVHESQSRWWENWVGRSLPFWRFYYPILQKRLPARLKKVPLERFYRGINAVEPSFIRVEADEVTYCLHIILRFQIEKELIGGTLSVEDLPQAWRAKMEEFLGVAPPTDRQGCLQDIHWSLGDFGYFPTYALGNLLAAQFFSAFAKDHPDYEERIASGDLAFIRAWQKENIHRWGRAYDTEQLMKKVSGKSLSAGPYLAYLKAKYNP
jgi:carboxypeptidase Taq